MEIAEAQKKVHNDLEDNVSTFLKKKSYFYNYCQVSHIAFLKYESQSKEVLQGKNTICAGLILSKLLITLITS